MFAFIKGILIQASPESVVLETHGVGYRIFIPLNHFSKLPMLNTEMVLYTSLIIREHAHTLYGFFLQADRDLYDQLLNVSGIGPKLALALIGHLSARALSQAVSEGDIAKLTKVPGIGKRSAERLLVELKGKIAENYVETIPPVESVDNKKRQRVKDAVSALINLGYTQSNAQRALQYTLEELGEEGDLATLITSALSYIKQK